MGEPQQLSGNELNAAVTSEVVRIHTANLGHGPAKSDSFPSERDGAGSVALMGKQKPDARPCGWTITFCLGLDLR
jgi:hypothetical protein